LQAVTSVASTLTGFSSLDVRPPMSRSVATIAPLFCGLLLGCGLVVLGVPEAEAQSRRGQQAPAQQRAAPGQGGAPGAAGTGLPSYAEPSSPPSSFGAPPSGATSPGRAQTNDAPNMPSNPDQVPLGGAEYLAAAGAAYALNRLRKQNGEDDEDEESDDMP